jgi:hypothetical protein
VIAYKGTLQIASDIGPYAQTIITACSQLPAGFRVDVVSIDPAVLAFGMIGEFAVPTEDEE